MIYILFPPVFALLDTQALYMTLIIVKCKKSVNLDKRTGGKTMLDEMHLSKPPLKVCLVTILFSTIQNMESYIPAIQDGFRKNGLPFFAIRKPQTTNLSTAGCAIPIEMKQWVFL